MQNSEVFSQRLEGLDLARFMALTGMVIVNFSIVMGVETASDSGLYSIISEALHGKAAALFVVLAGVGLGLSTRGDVSAVFYKRHFKRSLFLLILGLLNMLVFDADILHYYAFYFAFGAICLRWSFSALIASILTLISVFVVLVLVLEYDTSWNWQTYEYAYFWTPVGFVRNLFYNGWHPVIPWLAFLLWGLLLSRVDLNSPRVRRGALISHSAIFVLAMVLSISITRVLQPIDAEAAVLFSTQPIPPMPLYVLTGGSGAGIAIMLCLWIAPKLRKVGLLEWFTRPGRQTLTLYIAHIYLGMGVLEFMGRLGNQEGKAAVIASLLFCGFSIVYAWF